MNQKKYRVGDMRVVIKFAWLPIKKITAGGFDTWIWLRKYAEEQEYVAAGVFAVRQGNLTEIRQVTGESPRWVSRGIWVLKQ